MQDISAKVALIRYNMDDCAALKVVSESVELIIHQSPGRCEPDVTFTHTEFIRETSDQRGKFQQQQFELPAFEYINRCSYFDYQQDRVSAGGRSRLKREAAKSLSRQVPRYRNNKTVEVQSSRCPACRSKRLGYLRPLRRQVVDLKFSGVAVRRWIVLYLSREYRCQKCNAKFVPAGFPTVRTKFWRGLL